MKLPTYRNTPGLERYPSHEQFTVWRQAHKRLMTEDALYRKWYRTYQRRIIWIVAVFVSINTIVCLIPFFAGRDWIWRLGVFDLVTLPIYLWLVVRASFELQRFMNESIAETLQRQP